MPGIPKQAPSPRAVEAARDASRQSSPDHVQDVEISGIKARVVSLEKRVDALHAGQERVIVAVDSLTERVGEWELTAAGSEGAKVIEEQKTKRWMAMVGLLTMIVAPLGTVMANYATRDTSVHKPDVVIQSAMQLELEACQKAPSDQAWAECIRDTSIRNAPARQH